MVEDKHKLDRPIELRSTVVQEILGIVPNWMIRYGNTLILFLIVGIFAISYFVKYPITVTTEVAVYTAVPAQNLYASIDGAFLKLNIQDGARVNSGDLLGIINNNGEEVMLKSKLSGQVHFVDLWKIGRQIEPGDLLFRIVPYNHGPFIGKLKVGPDQVTKIKNGQLVRIYLSEDMMLKNDIIESVVQKVITVPDKDGFHSIEVIIGKELVTIADKAISYQPGLKAKAEIIVEDLRLIEHFFYQLRTIFNN